jgi:hypothetical protein
MGEEAKCIVGFAGHMIDRPDRKRPRFPPRAEDAVRLEIRNSLSRHIPMVAVSSAACGGDIIFAEESIDLKIPLYIILPFEDRQDFINRSVKYAGSEWVGRFGFVCSKAKEVLFVNPGGFQKEDDFEENQHAIIFFAFGYSQASRIQVVNLILYDPLQIEDNPEGTKNFTRSFLDLSHALGIPCEEIRMDTLRETALRNREEVNDDRY